MSMEQDLADYRKLLEVAGSFAQTEPLFRKFEQGIKRKYRSVSNVEMEWIRSNLADQAAVDDVKWFLAIVLRHAQNLTDSLLEPMLRAAVYEINPSMNRSFVEPAVREFGFRRVAERLLTYLMEGSNFEKSGAINAYYWARVGARNDTVTHDELRQRIRDKYLTEFIANDDIQVRRCLIPSLNADPSLYSPEVRRFLDVAINIARAHPDEYIRHRIEVQLGNESLLQPLPDRSE